MGSLSFLPEEVGGGVRRPSLHRYRELPLHRDRAVASDSVSADWFRVVGMNWA